MKNMTPLPNNLDAETISKLEEQTLKDLYILSVKKIEVRKLYNELRMIEKDMFDILVKMAGSIDEIVKDKGMIMLKEIIEKHKFLLLIEDSKKAFESIDRDFIENVENRARSLDSDLTKLSYLYNFPDYRTISDLENLEEKYKFEYDYNITKNPLSAMLIILIWNTRVLRDSLSSRAVWLSYKKP
jgi:hypothetical protein